MTNEEQKELIQKEAGRLWKSRGFKGCVLIITLLLIVMMVYVVRYNYYKVVCRTYLCYGVHYAFVIYANDFNDKLPPFAMWNDLLVEYTDTSEAAFHCPASESEGKTSDYSLNSNLSVDAWSRSEDSVMIFESTPGWNQAGDAAIFNFNNHHNGGWYNTISYAEGYFIKPAEVQGIQWKLLEEQVQND